MISATSAISKSYLVLKSMNMKHTIQEKVGSTWAHTQFLVRFHRFCPLITIGGSKILWSTPIGWDRWTCLPLRSSRISYVTSQFVVIFFAQNTKFKTMTYLLLLRELKFCAFCIVYKNVSKQSMQNNQNNKACCRNLIRI